MLSSGQPDNTQNQHFNDMLKYGSKVADPDFRPGQKDTKSQITYVPHSLKEYKQIQQNDVKIRSLSKGLGPNIGDEKW